jgi:hypothetical protein
VLVTRLVYGKVLQSRLIEVLLSDVLSPDNCVFRSQSAVVMSRISASLEMVLMTLLLGVQLCISPVWLGLPLGGMFSRAPFFVKRTQDLAELASRLGYFHHLYLANVRYFLNTVLFGASRC